MAGKQAEYSGTAGSILISQSNMPCRSDSSHGSNDMDIESDDIKVSDSVTVLWEVR